MNPPLFHGTYRFGMDRKGRVVVPASFRERMGDACILLRAPGARLHLLPSAAWPEITALLARSTVYSRYLLAGAHCCELDATTGRVLIPYDLRLHAALLPFSEVVVAGIGETAVICAADDWDAECRLMERMLTSFAPPLRVLLGGAA